MASTGVSSFRMLWDSTFDSWAQLGVVSQPAWGLFTPDGEFVEGNYGGIDTAAVLDIAADL